jgi:hypothetical protein
MKANWFKKIGWLYVPTSYMGVILTLAVLFFCATVFVAVDRHSHSVSDTLYGIFPYFISAFTLLFWISSNTSQTGNSL